MNILKLTLLALLAWHPLLAVAADTTTRAFALENIDHIDLRGSGKLLLTHGEPESLSIIGTDETLKNVEIHQKDGTLHLNNRSDGWKWFNWDSDEVTYAVTLKQLKRLTVTGSAHVVTNSTWAMDRLLLEVTGASHMSWGSLEIKHLEVKLTGASHLTIETLRGDELLLDLTGASKVMIQRPSEVRSQRVNLTGASHYTATQLKTQSTRADVSGASNAEVYATESLEVQANGASNVSYYGTPQAKASANGISNATYRGPAPDHN